MANTLPNKMILTWPGIFNWFQVKSMWKEGKVEFWRSPFPGDGSLGSLLRRPGTSGWRRQASQGHWICSVLSLPHAGVCTVFQWTLLWPVKSSTFYFYFCNPLPLQLSYSFLSVLHVPAFHPKSNPMLQSSCINMLDDILLLKNSREFHSFRQIYILISAPPVLTAVAGMDYSRLCEWVCLGIPGTDVEGFISSCVQTNRKHWASLLGCGSRSAAKVNPNE